MSCFRSQRPLLSLREIEDLVTDMAELVEADGDFLPTYGRSEDFARPHIEVDRRGYHYVVVERGEELERTTTRDLYELLYVIFDGVTSELSGRYEVANRIAGLDTRRLGFYRHAELMARLSPTWAERTVADYRATLSRYPFDDRDERRVDESSVAGGDRLSEYAGEAGQPAG